MSQKLWMCALLLFAACGEEEQTPLADAGQLDGATDPDGGDIPSDSGTIGRGITISTMALDLGLVVRGTAATGTFTLTNTGNTVVRVTVSNPMGGDSTRFSRTLNTSDVDGRFDLESGGEVVVTVSVTPEALGPLSSNILVDACQGECPTLIELSAEGVETGIVCDPQLDLGLVNPGACVTRNVACRNQGNATERVTAVELDPASDPAFSAAEPPLPAELMPQGALEFEVTFCPEAVGDLMGELVVLTFTPFETEQRITLLGHGGGADLSCTPQALDFGQVGLGATVRGRLTCNNVGFEPAQLAVSLATGTDFRVTTASASIAVGDSAIIEVLASPGAIGVRTDQLLLTSNDPDSPMLTVALRAEAINVGPCLAIVAPQSINFGVVNAGDIRAAAVRVQNVGPDTCLIRETTLVGASPSLGLRDAPVPGTAVAPGQSLVLQVTFGPTANAAAAGTLEVAFSNPGTSQLSVALSGQGGVAPLVVTPSSVDFGVVPTDCAEPQRRSVTLRRIATGGGPVSNVVLTNTGTAAFEIVASPSIPAQLDFYETLTLQIGFDPPGPGLYSAELRIFSGGANPIVVPLVAEARTMAPRVDTFEIEAPRVDVLFVVDNSAGQERIQAALASASAQFLTALTGRDADFHLGVVTSDMEAANGGGRLLGMPSYLEPSTPDLATTLAQRLQPGADGSGTEQGFAPTIAALGPRATQENVGFRRPDADLAVVWISNEDDQSQESVAATLAALHAAAGDRALHLVAVVGPASGNCSGPYGNAGAATRYASAIARQPDAILASYCANPADALTRLADRILSRQLTLSAPPVIGGLEVSANGAAIPLISANGDRNWGFDLSSNSLVFLAAPLVNGTTVTVRYPLVCTSLTCGNMSTEPNELCDDGNMISTDACIDCRPAVCGDTLVQATVEQCDDGNLIDTDACRSNCRTAACGDGVLQIGVEECDDGNVIAGDGCPATCRYYSRSGITSFNFQELQNPIALTFADNDDGSVSLAMPFPFTFYDVPTTSISVSVNGFASFLPIDTASSYTNVAIPQAAAPNGMMAVWWDDLLLDTNFPGGAQIGYQVLGTAPNRRLVIEWRDVRAVNHSSNNHRRFTFQLALDETTHLVRLRYGETETRGNPPTAVTTSAGIESMDGTAGLEALGCSPGCAGPARPQNANGFPRQSEVVFTP